MSENRLLWHCLGISFVLHTGMFLASDGFKISPSQDSKRKAVQVIYVVPPPARDLPKRVEKIKHSTEPSAKMTQVSKREGIPIPQTVKRRPLDTPKVPFEVAKELEKDMDYQRYYQLIRQRIQAYAEKNYRGFESSGIVHLAFILGQKGTLKGIKVFKKETVANDLLLQVAVRSVKDSTPFPAFPVELPHEELPFSIYIEFKRE